MSAGSSQSLIVRRYAVSSEPSGLKVTYAGCACRVPRHRPELVSHSLTVPDELAINAPSGPKEKHPRLCSFILCLSHPLPTSQRLSPLEPSEPSSDPSGLKATE